MVWVECLGESVFNKTFENAVQQLRERIEKKKTKQKNNKSTNQQVWETTLQMQKSVKKEEGDAPEQSTMK